MRCVKSHAEAPCLWETTFPTEYFFYWGQLYWYDWRYCLYVNAIDTGAHNDTHISTEIHFELNICKNVFVHCLFLCRWNLLKFCTDLRTLCKHVEGLQKKPWGNHSWKGRPLIKNLQFVPNALIVNMTTLVQTMSRRWAATSLFNQRWPYLLTHICVTRPRWVKTTYECRNLTVGIIKSFLTKSSRMIEVREIVYQQLQFLINSE